LFEGEKAVNCLDKMAVKQKRVLTFAPLPAAKPIDVDVKPFTFQNIIFYRKINKMKSANLS
jgi:hypothetical protein